LEKLTSDNLDSVAGEEKGPFVIKFFSPTCGPCHTMKPVIDALDQKNPEINIYEVDTSESPELAAHFEIRGVPAILVCENREVLYSFTGLTPLADMQFVLDNINDAYFRTHGHFKPVEAKKDWIFPAVVGGLLALFILLFIFV
jgi:thioredoxin 1